MGKCRVTLCSRVTPKERGILPIFSFFPVIPSGNHVIEKKFGGFPWYTEGTMWEIFFGGAQIGFRVVLFSSPHVAISFIMSELVSHKPRMPLFHNVGACISQAKNALVSSCWSLHLTNQECPCFVMLELASHKPRMPLQDIQFRNGHICCSPWAVPL